MVTTVTLAAADGPVGAAQLTQDESSGLAAGDSVVWQASYRRPQDGGLVEDTGLERACRAARGVAVRAAADAVAVVVVLGNGCGGPPVGPLDLMVGRVGRGVPASGRTAMSAKRAVFIDRNGSVQEVRGSAASRMAPSVVYSTAALSRPIRTMTPTRQRPRESIAATSPILRSAPKVNPAAFTWSRLE